VACGRLKPKKVTYDALITGLDALCPKGRHYFIRTQSLDHLRSETIEVLVERARRLSSLLSIFSIHHFHGAASRGRPPRRPLRCARIT